MAFYCETCEMNEKIKMIYDWIDAHNEEINKEHMELDFELNHNLTLYMGKNEEDGMLEMDYYLKRGYPFPKFSLVPDAGGPGVSGQFGRIEFNTISKHPVSENIVEFEVGQASNIIPSNASITLKKCLRFDAPKVPMEHYEVIETVCSATMATIREGRVCFRCGCRFTVSGVLNELITSIEEKMSAVGMSVKVLSSMNGSAIPADAPAFKIVWEEYEK